MQDVKVKAGEIALFECCVTGPQALDVDWLANGKLIQPALFHCKMQFDVIVRCSLMDIDAIFCLNLHMKTTVEAILAKSVQQKVGIIPTVNSEHSCVTSYMHQ